NEERRRPVLELASLDWNQWHLIAKQIEQEREVASFVSRHKFDVNSKWRET
ncbi:MAG: hypothetical protein HYY80_05780, partial [Chloroflexi bacterium]|nr:hypothetical protein [Chloroflexota bacterium]